MEQEKSSQKKKRFDIRMFVLIFGLLALAGTFVFFLSKDKKSPGEETGGGTYVFPAAFIPIWYAAARKKKEIGPKEKKIIVALVAFLVVGLALAFYFGTR